MKFVKKLFALLLLLSLVFSSSYSMAERLTEEDTQEFLQPQVEKDPAPFLNEANPQDLIRGTGNWSYVFELITPSGEKKILNSFNKNSLQKPASTMKLFTGWWAYLKKSKTKAYLSTMLHRSVNAMAQATYLNLGGGAAMKKYYQNYFEMDADELQESFRPADGSGLSYDNKATAAIEVKLLEKIYENEGYTDFRELLAQPGETGTLNSRLSEFDGKLFAKTGTLNRTASLAGFLETKSGTLIFSILSDKLEISIHDARAKINQLVRDQARSLNEEAAEIALSNDLPFKMLQNHMFP